MTLTEFLLARIAEDEERAAKQAATPRLPTNADVVGMWLGSRWYPLGDPNRVLAECEAKRRIVDSLRSMEEESPDDPYSWDDSSWGALTAWRNACKILALPYADHPDYREEWKP